jgi:hypothetical protein
MNLKSFFRPKFWHIYLYLDFWMGEKSPNLLDFFFLHFHHDFVNDIENN